MPSLLKVLWCTKSSYTLSFFNVIIQTSCHVHALQPPKINKKILTKSKLFFQTNINWKFCQKPLTCFISSRFNDVLKNSLVKKSFPYFTYLDKAGRSDELRAHLSNQIHTHSTDGSISLYIHTLKIIYKFFSMLIEVFE